MTEAGLLYAKMDSLKSEAIALNLHSLKWPEEGSSSGLKKSDCEEGYGKTTLWLPSSVFMFLISNFNSFWSQ